MRKTLWLMASLFLLTACTTNTPTVVEPTLVTPTQTLQVTKTPFPTFTTTPKVETPTLTPISSELVDMDPAYFDGIVVITQYLTYLDLGLYKEAYELLHPGGANLQSEEDFMLGAEKAYQSVEIKTIQPYFIWAENHGLLASSDTENQKQFYVEFVVNGDPGWWPGNDPGLIFTLGTDNDMWRIISQDAITKSTDQSIPLNTARIDPNFFDGIIVITEYYTFLDQGRFEESYQLLSSSIRDKQNRDEYITMAAMFFKTVKIVKIQPYYYFAKHQGWDIKPEIGTENQYYIQIIAEGEGGMSGSSLNGEVQTKFLSFILENSERKINTFSTSPF